MVELKKIENDDVLEYVGFVAAKFCVPMEAQGDEDHVNFGLIHAKRNFRQWYNYYSELLKDMNDPDNVTHNALDAMRESFDFNIKYSNLPKILIDHYQFDAEKFWFLLVFIRFTVDWAMDTELVKAKELAIYEDLKSGADAIIICKGHNIEIPKDMKLRNKLLLMLKEAYDWYHIPLREVITKKSGHKDAKENWAKVKLFLDMLDYFLHEYEGSRYQEIKRGKHGNKEDWDMKIDLLLIAGYISNDTAEEGGHFISQRIKYYVRKGITLHNKLNEEAECPWYYSRKKMRESFFCSSLLPKELSRE